jgi:hypothetical protein
MTHTSSALVALVVLVMLAGCTTARDTSTYSGSAKAAVLDTFAAATAVIKEKTGPTGTYVRDALSRPMPVWTPAVPAAAPSPEARVTEEAVIPRVQVYSVIPAEGGTGASLTVEADGTAGTSRRAK